MRFWAFSLALCSLLAVGIIAAVVTIQILQGPNIVTTTTYQVTQVRSTWDAAWGTGCIFVLAFSFAAIILALAWDDLKH